MVLEIVGPRLLASDLDVKLQDGRIRPRGDGKGMPVAINRWKTKKGMLTRLEAEQHWPIHFPNDNPKVVRS
jgi:hypothetical protein